MKFFVHKLGCPKNDVDADYIAARLIDDGHQPVGTPEEADSVIVNTCGFITAAKEESITEILRLAELKKSGRVRQLLAAGCLTQRYGDEMLKEMPELDGAFGHGALDSIARAVGGGNGHRPERTVKLETRKLGYISWKHRFIADAYPYSYLKISDGCDRGCTYCAIPGMRGRFRSRPIQSILTEARFLAQNGKKELILVSQEATCYGYDLPGRPGIVDLLRELELVEGIEWIRLMYLYPAALDDALIDYMAAPNKTLNYFDLPLQHVNTDILTAMRRRVERTHVEHLIDRIRATSDDAVIRTTFIVGFPGETEAQFDELYDFVERYRFDRMGVFPYSPEEGTPAERFGRQVSEATKVERMDRLMNLQREIAFEINNSLIGQSRSVIIDTVRADGRGIGRTTGDCPEIDQEVFVSGEGLEAGRIRTVVVDAVDGYDLVGHAVRDEGHDSV
ncbi:MAG: 30S ribosomal protein S12 methylthiotransferase RimO [candidate division Zixibacteria bacterium]|jgi:ribosomal protein S12 methylthiotransferase|nr:30S ribosomal protein S12 methylthiotransferase RimO [candidate division Zixibacteria bacterium]